jgi:hypothetical protein
VCRAWARHCLHCICNDLFSVANSRTPYGKVWSVSDVVWGWKCLDSLLCGEIIISGEADSSSAGQDLPRRFYITKRFIALFTKAGRCALSEADECSPRIRIPFL